MICSAVSNCSVRESWLTSPVWISSDELPLSCVHPFDRLAQRAGRVGVRRVGEADMAVADLHEAQLAPGRFGRLRAARRAERIAARRR